MQRISRVFLVLSVASIPPVAAAEEVDEEDTDTSASAEPTTDKPLSEKAPASAQAGPAAANVTPAATDAALVAPPPSSKAEPKALLEGWQTEFHGYFRAPMALGISSRPNPDEVGRLDVDGNPIPDGPSHLQIAYAPNRVMDWSYYSFAYTRLQEQDWAEFFVHQKKKHVDAAVGWMGYWLSSAGYRHPDAAWVPGMAYLTLDNDFEVADVKPNIALTMGAWWPQFGYFEKYDTCTLGRFRQLGEQLQLTVPLSPALTATLVQGFGTNRDGAYNPIVAQNSPLYAGKTGLDLIAWANLRVTYEKLADIGLHWNREWTRDDRLSGDGSSTDGKAYSQASQAHLSVVGGEASLRVPYAGRVWISPSLISVKNGWALGSTGGTEVMHGQGGLGVATNYLQWAGAPPSSTGSGSIFGLGFLYEETLSEILGKAPGSLPDFKFSAFGLMANASLDLPTTTTITLKTIKQLKYGLDLTVQALDWLALMGRFDTVNYDTDIPGYVFSAITGRLAISSHYLSGESIYLQYSRYIYGDKMVLAGKWEMDDGGSGWPLVAGSDVLQNYGSPSSYYGKKPDENVIKLQAQIAF
jgi:hypothetical protein